MVEIPQSWNSICPHDGFLPTCSCSPQGKKEEEAFPILPLQQQPPAVSDALYLSELGEHSNCSSNESAWGWPVAFFFLSFIFFFFFFATLFLFLPCLWRAIHSRSVWSPAWCSTSSSDCFSWRYEIAWSPAQGNNMLRVPKTGNKRWGFLVFLGMLISSYITEGAIWRRFQK